MGDYNLSKKSSLWYHSITDNTWDKSSYSKIMNINNFFDYNIIADIFKQNHYQNGMFFCMKENVFPNWEDPENRNGGCLSFKISSDKIINEWNNLLFYFLNDMILSNNNHFINGISISPKKEFNIIKIWFSENIKYHSIFNVSNESLLTIDNSLYKSHDIY